LVNNVWILLVMGCVRRIILIGKIKLRKLIKKKKFWLKKRSKSHQYFLHGIRTQSHRKFSHRTQLKDIGLQWSTEIIFWKSFDFLAWVRSPACQISFFTFLFNLTQLEP
jgi:hypothetical protein